MKPNNENSTPETTMKSKIASSFSDVKGPVPSQIVQPPPAGPGHVMLPCQATTSGEPSQISVTSPEPNLEPVPAAPTSPPVPGGPLPTPDEDRRRIPRKPSTPPVRRRLPSRDELIAEAQQLDIPGLTVFPETVGKPKGSQQGRYMVETQCDACGHRTRQVLTALAQGKPKKCRCQGGVHNHADPVLHSLRLRYRSMMQRCYKDTHPSSHNYKGRGIEVHFESLEDFVDWVYAEFPERVVSGIEGWDFDRIDNDGHYAKDNLRLVRPGVNALNRRHSPTSIRSKADQFMSRHPELTYTVVTLRNLFQQGLGESEILARHEQNKGRVRRPRSQAPKYRSTAAILGEAGGAVVYPLSHPKHGQASL